MAQLSEKTLAWLYNVLHEYREPQRAYNDAARCLADFPTLSPRTEVYVFENGSSSLLLTLSGTLPTTFRGTLYQFPIKVWLPRTYPQDSPFLYVTPSKEMQVRVGQHIGDDGRIYHPYLRDWSGMGDRASMVALLAYIQQAFSKEPPVTSKRQPTVDLRLQRSSSTAQQQTAVRTSSFAGPQLPPKQDLNAQPMPAQHTNGPPPRPPKPGEPSVSQQMDQTGPPLPPPPGDIRPDRQSINTGPPLPPLPYQRPVLNASYRPSASEQDRRTSWQPPISPTNSTGRSASYAQPVQSEYLRYVPQNQSYDRSSVSPLHQNGTSELPDNRRMSYMHAQPFHDGRRQSSMSVQSIQQHPQRAAFQQFTSSVATQQRPPARDLLSDSLEVRLSLTTTNAPAPPVPVNPEKEYLLQALSATLVQQVQQRVQQNVAALVPLQTQQNALRTAYSQLEAELAQLQSLDAAIANNEAILRRSIQDCDRTIDKARMMKQPPVDDVLVAPTLVAQQLWTASVDEAACREAMYVLQKAVDRGRINGNDFVRQMRGLSRECFLKMALARKCAQGLGLNLAR